jgi:sulfate transport system ATP-binding protein
LHEELHITSIFVSHDQDEAREVADQVVLMNRGRVEQQGATEEVYARPTSAFASSFLGAINRLPGEVQTTGLKVGPDHVSAVTNGLEPGSKAILLARPHELRIVPDGDGTGLAAKVVRIIASGALARIELEGEAVINGSGSRPSLEVEVSVEELVRLNLSEGQRVRLEASGLRAFPHGAEQDSGSSGRTRAA